MIFPADFAALALELDPLEAGAVLYRPSALVAVCEANALDAREILADQDRACEIIAAWYLDHRETGGKPDSVAEAIVARLAAAPAAPSKK